MKITLLRVWLIIESLFLVFIAGCLGLIIFVSIVDFSFEDILLAGNYALGISLMIGTNAFYLVRNIKRNEKVFFKAMCLKFFLLFFFFGLGYLNPIFEEVFAAIIFMIFGVPFLIMYIVLVRNPFDKPVQIRTNQQVRRQVAVDPYDLNRYFEQARNEFVSIYHEENVDLIQEYAATPFSYFFKWLIDNNYIVPTAFSIEEIEAVKSGSMSPVSLLKKNGYIFKRDYLVDSIQSFVNAYTSTHLQLRYDRQSYIFDYYLVIRNEEKRFYCLPFSLDTYREIASRINDQYIAYRNGKIDDSIEEQNVDEFSTSRYKCIQVTTIGNVSQSYRMLCIESFKNLPEIEYTRLSKKLKRNMEVEDMDPLEELDIDEMVIFEPKGNEPAYILCGEASFEEEHGIMVSVFNDVVLEVGYRYDYDSPWDYHSQAIYHGIHRHFDFSKIRSNEDLTNAFNNHDLVTTYIYSPRFGGEKTNGNVMYITPEALQVKWTCEDMIDCIKARGFDIQVQSIPHFEDGYPVVKYLTLRATLDGNFVFYENIYIWD